jgi:NitT/TauT family transport system ATP-binding protein
MMASTAGSRITAEPARTTRTPVRLAAANPRGAVKVSGLNHTYDVAGRVTKALEDITFAIEPGRFVVVVGPSGCGKSSLLMMMTGLLRPTSGSILCGGAPMTTPDPDRVGVVFQEASLYPWLTALSNVEFPLSLKGVAKADRAARAREKLKLVGLAGFEDRYPHELSGGMKQRVSIARGLVQDPPILMLDEPFAALDEQTRLTMGDELLRIWEETGKTVVFVTHSLTEAAYLADEIIVMSARPGRIIDRIDVDLPRPRTMEMMATAQFGALRERIWKQIRTEASRS